jgi:hypothetical protein
MATVNSGAIPAERIVTVGDFVEGVYVPWIEQHKRPSTAKGYRDIWEDHLKPLCSNVVQRRCVASQELKTRVPVFVAQFVPQG